MTVAIFVLVVLLIVYRLKKNKQRIVKNRPLSGLKRGDVISIEYGYSINQAVVLYNDPKTAEIRLRVRIMGYLDVILGTGSDEMRYYSSYNFQHYEALNR